MRREHRAMWLSNFAMTGNYTFYGPTQSAIPLEINGQQSYAFVTKRYHREPRLLYCLQTCTPFNRIGKYANQLVFYRRTEVDAVFTDAVATNESLANWYAARWPENVFEKRMLQNFRMFEYRHSAAQSDVPPDNSALLKIMLDGGKYFRLNDAQRSDAISPEFGHLVLPTARLAGVFDLNGETHGVSIDIPLQAIEKALSSGESAIGGSLQGVLPADRPDRRLRNLMLAIWRAAKGDVWAPDLDPDWALLRIVEILRSQSQNANATGEGSYRLAPHIRKLVMRYIEESIDGNLSLFELATVAGLSPSHFARAFRLDMGDPPHRYVMARRLSRARDVIVATRLPLSEIAASFGFASQQHMTTAFAKYLGTTPGRLRK